MTRYKLYITRKAYEDIDNITEYLKNFSINIADNHNTYIAKTIRSLVTTPNRCSLVKDENLHKLSYRWLSAKNYIIYFRVIEDKKIVRIERILHSKQEYDVIL